MIIKEVLSRTTQFFKEKGIHSPRLDAEVLMSACLNWKRVDLYTRFEEKIDEVLLNELRELVKRRSRGEPVAYILGKKEFFGFEFKVCPGVLIPRPETELIVDQAVSFLKDYFSTNPNEKVSIIDLGCGSGCIGLSLLKKFENVELVACDQSETAIEVTKQNAENLGVLNRTNLLKADLFNTDNERLRSACLYPIQLVVSNPPYIAFDDPEVQESVKQFEPFEALFAENNGLAAIEKWTEHAYQLLENSGLCLFEIGYQQAHAASLIFQKAGFSSDSMILQDYSRKPRVIRATKT